MYMKKLFKKIRWYFAERKAKKELEMAYFGGRLVRAMYPESEFKIEGSIAHHQILKVFEEIDNAKAQLELIKKYKPV